MVAQVSTRKRVSMYDPEAFKDSGYRPTPLIKQVYLHNQMMDKIKKDYKTDEEEDIEDDEEKDSDEGQ